MLAPAVTRWLAAARLVLWVERIWPPMVGLASLAAVFVALALFDILPRLPGWAHALVLALFGGAGLALIPTLLRRLRLPDRETAARRLEFDSGLAHRPLATLADRPVGASPLGDALWHDHCLRMARALDRLRLAPPHSDMAARDPVGLRAGALLILVMALSGGTHQLALRLERAMHPAIALPGIAPETIDVWITPPAYTGVAPLLLRPGQEVTVPAGSTVLAALGGGWDGGTLSAGGRSVDFSASGEASRRAELILDHSTSLTIGHWGRTLAQWPVQVIVDAAPSVSFADPPDAADRGRLRLALTASDDYGLARLWVEIRRAGLDERQTPLVVDLPLGPSRPRSLDLVSWQDLSAHPWAGLPVTIRPLAEDGRGQSSGGDWVAMALPERHFNHPGARAIIEQRRQLTLSTVRVLDVIIALDAISNDRTQFGDDLLTFLALRVARHALTDEAHDVADVQDLLWNAALRIEDGDLAGAERTLEQARLELQQAIQSGAGASRVEELVDALQAALERWLQAMAARTPTASGPSPPSDQILDGEDLAAMMDTFRDLARNGAREALAALMQDLTTLLQMAQRDPTAPPTGPAVEGFADLREVARRQQNLLDHSHRTARLTPAPPGSAGAAGQDAVRAALDAAIAKLTQGLGSPPAALDAAKAAMDSAIRSLRRSDWADAATQQAVALEQLRQAARSVLEQMSAGLGAAARSPERDPLGRPTGRPQDDGTTRLPHRAELNKSQHLLDELRRRAVEGSRPQSERDYLHRLLRQF
jgi:uncharacterized protein (TIGR02302 family)